MFNDNGSFLLAMFEPGVTIESARRRVSELIARDTGIAFGQILDAGYVVLPTGRDLENNRIYVWPYFAELPLVHLTPPQEVELLRLMGAAAAGEAKTKGRYSSWRIAIGADGVWHSFHKMP